MIFPYRSPFFVRSCRDFLTMANSETGVVVFICPAVDPEDTFLPHYQGLDVPVYILNAEQKPGDYKEFHPPVHVMGWYAENLASWLKENNLIPLFSLTR